MVEPIENPGYVDSTVLQRLTTVTEKLKQRTTELLQIKLGDRVLDVGCGPGTDTISMAQIIGEGGFVVGIDYNEALIRNARKRAAVAGVGSWVSHEVGDASSLPYKSNTFDACRSERLFQHVTDCKRVLKEMFRVTKPHGRIAVSDSDWCSLSIDTTEIDIERKIVQCIANLLYNGYAGRQLFRLFHGQQLANIIVEVHPIVWTDYKAFRATSFSLIDLEQRLVEAGAVSEEELQRFLASLEEAHQRGAFFASGNLVLAAGTKAM